MKKRLALKIYGNVHGVGYRYSVRNFAKARDIQGWVKNNSEGTVSVVAEGEEKDLEALLDFCYNGIDFAQVQHIDRIWEERTGGFHDFSINPSPSSKV